MAHLPLNLQFPLAAEVAWVLNLEYEYDALSCKFLFCHRASGATFPSIADALGGMEGAWAEVTGQ